LIKLVTESLTSFSFYINLPIGGVAAAFIVYFFLTPKEAKTEATSNKEKLKQMDIPGTIILTGAIICLILGLQWGGISKPWNSSPVIGTFVGFGLIVLVFIGLELWQGENALVVPRVIKMKTIWLLALFNFLNFGSATVLFYYIPIYFQVIFGVSASQSGIRNLPLILSLGKPCSH
jgi:hypothetical protein